MSMLDRRTRKDGAATVPTSAGPDEETVRLATKDFRKRRRSAYPRTLSYWRSSAGSSR